jgi:predicted methyltransferase
MGTEEMVVLGEVAAEAAEASGLPVSWRDVERLVVALWEGPQDVWQLTALSRCPFNAVLAILASLRSRGWVNVNERAWLTPSGRKTMQGLTPYPSTACAQCFGTGVSLAGHEALLERFAAIASGRPSPVPGYDQGYLTVESSIRRVLAMASRGDLSNKDLLVLGDDDLISIAAALTGLPRKVTVVEIDRRLTDFIDGVAEDYVLPIRTVALDLRLPLPAEFRRAFDTFITDPPDTAPGQILFLSRGISGLRGAGCAGYFGFTLVEANLYTWREVQGFLFTDARFAVTDMLPDFSRYENWPYLLDTVDFSSMPELARQPETHWYRSTFYRIEALSDSRFDLDPEVAHLRDEDLYLSGTSLIKPAGGK